MRDIVSFPHPTRKYGKRSGDIASRPEPIMLRNAPII